MNTLLLMKINKPRRPQAIDRRPKTLEKPLGVWILYNAGVVMLSALATMAVAFLFNLA